MMESYTDKEKRDKNLDSVTKSVHYNPTGPGDYFLPSVFDFNHKKKMTETIPVKQNPCYTIGKRHQSKAIEITPGPGAHDPIKNSDFSSL